MFENTGAKIQFLQITTQMMYPIALYTAVKLNIADALGYTGANLETIARAVGCQSIMLHRLMRYLVAHEVFSIDARENYQLNAFSEHLLTDHPDSMKELLLIFNERAMHSFTHLHDTMITMQPAYKALYGDEYFGDLSADSSAQACYTDAMANYSRGEGEMIVNSYDFSKYKTIADIGGGKSDLLPTLNRHFPDAHLYLLDQPGVINHLQKMKPEHTTFIPCNFFEAVNVSADCLILKRVLHDWDDESCITILKNCRPCMSGQTKLLIIDAIIPQTFQQASNQTFNQDKMILALDLQLLCLHGGIERTTGDFAALCKESNLNLQRIIKTSGLLSIVEVII